MSTKTCAIQSYIKNIEYSSFSQNLKNSYYETSMINYSSSTQFTKMSLLARCLHSTGCFYHLMTVYPTSRYWHESY